MSTLVKRNGSWVNTANSISHYQTGTAKFTEAIPANGYKYIDVPLSTVMPDTDYCVVFSHYSAAHTYADAYIKSTDNIRIYLYNTSDTDVGANAVVTWQAFKVW